MPTGNSAFESALLRVVRKVADEQLDSFYLPYLTLRSNGSAPPGAASGTSCGPSTNCRWGSRERAGTRFASHESAGAKSVDKAA